MKPPKIALLAGAAFAVSFFLPAYVGSNGFECLEFCWKRLLEPSWKTSEDVFGWLYYGGFVPTNLLFLVLLGFSLRKIGCDKTRFVASSILFFHVLSWLFINLVKDRDATLQFQSLQAGYYLWLFAYAALVASHFIPTPIESEPEASADTAPAA